MRFTFKNEKILRISHHSPPQKKISLSLTHTATLSQTTTSTSNMYVDLHYHVRQLIHTCIRVDCNTKDSCQSICTGDIPTVTHFADPSFQTNPYIYTHPFLSTMEMYVLDQEFSDFADVHLNDNLTLSIFIHSFSILSDDRSKASTKTIPPHSAI